MYVNFMRWMNTFATPLYKIVESTVQLFIPIVPGPGGPPPSQKQARACQGMPIPFYMACAQSTLHGCINA